MNILIIAAHSDDEVLGMGATISKISKKNRVELIVTTESATSQYDDPKMIKVRHDACLRSAKILGIKNVNFLNYPDNQLDTIPQLEINQKIEKIIQKFKPRYVYTTPGHDLNKDHRQVFDSTIIASRPGSSSVEAIFSYELPGFIKTPFKPNIFENIEKEFPKKLAALKEYKTEIMKFPHPRSIESIKNLATYRGIQSGLKQAEAFELVHKIIS